MKKYKIGYTTGVFDLFHIGHVNILKNAKEQCEFLIVGITSDELCYARKNKSPVIKFNERVEILSAIRYVDQVVVQSDMNKLDAVKKYGVDVVFVGSDWQGSPEWITYEKQFALVGCHVIYLPHTDGTSSTMLKEVLGKYK